MLTSDHTGSYHSLKCFAVTVISRVPLIIADILLIYITWLRLSSRDVLKDIRLRKPKSWSLSAILLCNGMLFMTYYRVSPLTIIS